MRPIPHGDESEGEERGERSLSALREQDEDEEDETWLAVQEF